MLHPEQPQEQEPPPFFFFLTMLTITMPTITSKTNKTIKVGKFMLSLSYLFLNNEYKKYAEAKIAMRRNM